MTQDTIPTGPLSLSDWQDELKELAAHGSSLSPKASPIRNCRRRGTSRS
jgi:hypothetical protein